MDFLGVGNCPITGGHKGVIAARCDSPKSTRIGRLIKPPPLSISNTVGQEATSKASPAIKTKFGARSVTLVAQISRVVGVHLRGPVVGRCFVRGVVGVQRITPIIIVPCSLG